MFNRKFFPEINYEEQDEMVKLTTGFTQLMYKNSASKGRLLVIFSTIFEFEFFFSITYIPLDFDNFIFYHQILTTSYDSITFEYQTFE